jgi:hypothetical protein
MASVEADNILIYPEPGTELLVAFASMGGAYDETQYEFRILTEDYTCSRVFCKDMERVWYHLGTGGEVNSIPALREKLKEIIAQLRPTKVSFLGASTGGYAALLFGHMLKVDTVHAFGPQTFLSAELWERYEHPTDVWTDEIAKTRNLPLDPSSRYFDLKEVLEEDNKVTSYHVHLCHQHRVDALHEEHIRFCPGVCFHYYDCTVHSVAAYLKEAGRLTNTLERH